MSGRPVIGSLYFAHTAYTLHRHCKLTFAIQNRHVLEAAPHSSRQQATLVDTIKQDTAIHNC